jgi:hypothetical protein
MLLSSELANQVSHANGDLTKPPHFGDSSRWDCVQHPLDSKWAMAAKEKVRTVASFFLQRVPRVIQRDRCKDWTLVLKTTTRLATIELSYPSRQALSICPFLRSGYDSLRANFASIILL